MGWEKILNLKMNYNNKIIWVQGLDLPLLSGLFLPGPITKLKSTSFSNP